MPLKLNKTLIRHDEGNAVIYLLKTDNRNHVLSAIINRVLYIFTASTEGTEIQGIKRDELRDKLMAQVGDGQVDTVTFVHAIDTSVESDNIIFKHRVFGVTKTFKLVDVFEWNRRILSSKNCGSRPDFKSRLSKLWESRKATAV